MTNHNLFYDKKLTVMLTAPMNIGYEDRILRILLTNKWYYTQITMKGDDSFSL